MKYKVGENVRVRDWEDMKKQYGMFCRHINAPFIFLEEMKHTCGEVCKITKAYKNGSDNVYKIDKSNYVFHEDVLLPVPVNTKKIVITSDGTETLARLYDGNEVIKSATAKCSPDDTLDFEVGAKLAYDRLMTKTESVDLCISANKLESDKYKAGDKVKVIANTCYHYCRIGEIVTLTDIIFGDKRGIAWRMEERRGYIKECDFEPYFEPYEKPETEWRVVDRPAKVGDYIRIKGQPFSFNYDGEILKVDAIDSIGDVQVMVFGRNHKNNTHYASMLWRYCDGEYEVVERVIEQTHYNGKVVCVEASPGYSYTVGKVYEFKDGRVVIDNGNKIPSDKPVKSLDEWNNDSTLYAKFIPLVE